MKTEYIETIRKGKQETITITDGNDGIIIKAGEFEIKIDGDEIRVKSKLLREILIEKIAETVVKMTL